MVREGRVFISVATDPDFASNYYVTAYEVGAQVTSASSGTTATVRAGHGFAALDKFIVFRNGSYVANSYNTVSAVGATTLTITAFALAQDDILVNLAQDTGIATPLYDGNGLAVYSDMAYSSQLTNNTTQTDANGRFRYFYNNIPIWELVRDSLGAPFSIFLDTGVSGIAGPASSTDNAVVRWDGTNGQLTQNSVVTISDTGATTGITTLGVSGALTAAAAVTVGTTLTVTGTSTVAAVNASGTVAMAGAATVGTTLTVTGLVTMSAAATVGTTLTVTGAASLNSTLAVAGNTTISGFHMRSVNAAVTASTTHTQVGATALTKDINNVSVCANADDAVKLPSAVAGMMVSVFNNGAANLRIWPASGDNLGTGVDTVSAAFSAQSNVTFCCYDATNWEII